MRKKIIASTMAFAMILSGFFICKTYNSANAIVCENIEALSSRENVEFVDEECYVADPNGDHIDVYRATPVTNKFGGFCNESYTFCEEDGTCVDIVVWGKKR